MRSGRPRVLAGLALGVLAVLVTVTAAVPVAAGSGEARAEGLPAGVPPAAHGAAPALPAPAVWPFDEAFPRTSGTGRLAGGAVFWTDFLYDDSGALGVPVDQPSVGAPSFGAYRYPEPEHANNGADVFRAAIGLDGDDTWWRVDWNTLVDAGVPIAAFAVDADDDPATGSSSWTVNAGIGADGTDAVVLVSGAGAWLVDPSDGTRTPVDDLGGQTWVDEEARSFLVRLPADAFDLGQTSTARLAAGLADDAGEAFHELGSEHGALPGQPNVYNVAFRSVADEPPENNFWMDSVQATALASGDIDDFALTVEWGRLAAGETEPEPRPTGYSNRWYVSSVEVGDGVGDAPATSFDGEPTYLGRVQPYAIHVPESYDAGTPAALTFVLHSLAINHNQFGATAPGFLDLACEERGSICLTPLGRGPDGWYRDEAELDLWEVWKDVATHFTLADDRTAIGGYSMGGFGAIRLALDHPDVFAATYLVAAAGTDELDRIENARWTPYYHAHGALDQLVPVGDAEATVAAFDDLGYRYVFDLHPAEDHVAYSLKDGFDAAAAFLAEEHRVASDVGRITYRFRPGDVDGELGLGPDGAWWLTGAVARDGDGDARVDATSHARPDPDVSPVRSETAVADAAPSPAIRRELVWELGASPEAQPLVEADATNLAALRLDLDGAALDPRSPGATVRVTTDGDLSLTLAPLDPGTRVLVDGEPDGTVGGDRRHTVALPGGAHDITFRRGAAAPPASDGAPSALPATGVGAPLGALALALAAGIAVRGRRVS